MRVRYNAAFTVLRASSVFGVGRHFWTLLREPLAISVAIPVAVKFGVGI